MQNFGLLILRASVSLMMLITHGLPKFLNFSERVKIFPDPLGLGIKNTLMLVIFAEVFCAFLITIGFLTRLAAIPLVINMAIATFIVHKYDPWSKQEFALLYGLVFLAIIFIGPGKYSIDGKIFPKKKPKSYIF